MKNKEIKKTTRELKEDTKELKQKIHEMNVFLQKTFGNKSQLDKLDIEMKYEGMVKLLKYNLFGVLSDSLTLIKLREMVEGELTEPY